MNEINALVGDEIGMIHLISSCLSLMFGTLVLIMKKGSRLHVKMGYAYVVCMVILIITAFMIYRLFGRFDIFHYTTVVSLVTLCLGMIPIWLKKPSKSWKLMHFSFMYWSVIGLYAAFAAEIMTRIPETPFYSALSWATGGIMLLGGLVFAFKIKKWQAVFELK